METKTIIISTMSRKELAEKYGVSGKTFAKRLINNGLDFGSVRVLLPSQVRQVIDKFGYWEETINAQ